MDELEELPTVVDGFEIKQQIGSGAFGRVHLARHIPTNMKAAAKICNLSKMKASEINSAMHEISAFMQISAFPYICALYRYSIIKSRLIFFIEYMSGGNLLSYLNNHGPMAEDEARRVFIQIFSAVRFLHTNHFLVHRDIKLENILLDSNGNAKLSDFGLSASFYYRTLRSFCGTPGFVCPEAIVGGEYDDKCDIWSLGVCLYAMVSGGLPFHSNYHSTLVKEAESLSFPDSFSQSLIDFLKRMFEVSSSMRPSAVELQSHPWLLGIPKINRNITPIPIVFYQINKIDDIKKFRRRKSEIDESIIEKCISLGCKSETLKKEISEGIVDDITTTYFILLHPCEEYMESSNSSRANASILKNMRISKLAQPKLRRVVLSVKGTRKKGELNK